MLLSNFLKELDPSSSKYIIKIILGKLRLGFSDMTILDSFSWMCSESKSNRKNIEEVYNVCADIGRVGYLIKKYGVSNIN